MKKVKLNDIAEFIRTGKTPPTSQTQYFDGSVNWYTPGDFNNGKKLKTSRRTLTQIALDDRKAITFPKDTLLITCIGDIGKIGITQEDCSSNQQITGIKPKENTDVNYLYYWFIANKKILENTANSAVVPILNNKTLQNIDFELSPLPTQQKIAAILDKADELRQYNKQLIEKYDALTQSLFLDMFGDPSKNSKKWEIDSFGSYITVLTDYHANGSYESLKEVVELKDERDFALMVRTTDLEKNNFDNDVKFITEEAYNFLTKSKVFGNEIIINKIGSAGNVYLMPILNRPVSLGMNAFLLRFNEKQLNVIFTYFLLKTKYCESEIQKRVKGAVTKTIRKDAIREIPIIVPPIDLQNQFAERVQLIETQKQQAQEALAKSEELFQSLLQRAFKGELN